MIVFSEIPYERFSIMIPRSDSGHISESYGADSEIHYFEDAHEKFTTIYNNLQQWTWCGTRKWGLTKKLAKFVGIGPKDGPYQISAPGDA